MNLAADETLQELNRLIQIETDPQKITVLADLFAQRLKQLLEIDQPKPEPWDPPPGRQPSRR